MLLISKLQNLKNIILSLIASFLIVSCSVDKKLISETNFVKVSIDTLIQDQISSRAILIDGNKVWYAGNKGQFGSIPLSDKGARYKGVIEKNNLNIEFRSIAQTSRSIFILSVSNPALLYKIDKKSKQIRLVYEEKHEKVFYDSMQFLNNKEGFAIGDPTEDCPSIIKTTDGGKTWKKVSCNNLPKFEEGEAFFAASNTNLILTDNAMFMISGGKKSRAFVSVDKGENWEIYESPIIQGGTMTGAFCADFYNDSIGIMAGGNYEKPLENIQNKAITNDGGKTWKLVSDNAGFGYASCIQYVPDSNGKGIVEVGANGIFYSNDSGLTWKQLAEDKDLLTFRFIDDRTAVATGKNRIVRLVFK